MVDIISHVCHWFIGWDLRLLSTQNLKHLTVDCLIYVVSERWSFLMIGRFQKISIPYHGRLACFNPPLPSEIPKCVTPHFQLSNAYTNKRTWIFYLCLLIWRVRTGRKNSSNHGKNGKKTTQRATSAIWRIFAELDKPKCALSKMNSTSMDRWR